MFAIIETGGKQYKVAEGDIIYVEKLDAAEGDKVTFDKVLALQNSAGFQTGSSLRCRRKGCRKRR